MASPWRSREYLRMLAGDVRYSARTLTKAPGFVLAALLAIVLGVSATTTVFSLIQAVLIRSLPYGNPQRLVYMWTPLAHAAGLRPEYQPYYSDVAAWQKASRSFESITGFSRYRAMLNDSQEQVGGAHVFGNFFQTLGVRPILGRMIEPRDDKPGNPPVAVISDRVWWSSFGGSRRVIGAAIRINRQPYRVIGVMPKEFSYPHGNDYPNQFEFALLARTDVWVPAALTPQQRADWNFEGLDAVVGRLRGGFGVKKAQSEIWAIENGLPPHEYGRMHVLLAPFVETAIGPVRPLMRLLAGAVCLVLLLACGNLASLLMARAAGRVHELGVRTALGAPRARLVRLLVTESMLLSITGGVVALALSYAALQAIAKLNPGDIPRFEEMAMDWRVLLFGLAVSAGSGLIAGAVPALAASFVDVSELLRQGGRGTAKGAWRERSALIVSEIALAVVLLAGAGLLIRSYLAVQGEDKGFASSTLTFSVVLGGQTPGADRVRRELMERIQALSGVQAAGSIDDLPLSASEDFAFIEAEGYTSRLKQIVSLRGTGGEYFRAMRIPLIAGRYLNNGDIGGDQPRTVVVSAGLANAYFRGRNAIGQRIQVNGPRWSTIVGVVGNIRHSSLEEKPQPVVYFQKGWAESVAIRTAGSPEAIAASVRRIVSAFGAGAAVTNVQTMGQYVERAAARRRFQTAALTAFAGVAVILTLVGLYGLIAYAVRQRTAEIGVRMALGASPGAVAWMVMVSGVRLTAVGLAIGLCAALAVARAMASFLYGVPAADPVTFCAVPAFMISVTAAACIAPAWRAARTDPLSALREG